MKIMVTVKRVTDPDMEIKVKGDLHIDAHHSVLGDQQRSYI